MFQEKKRRTMSMMEFWAFLKFKKEFWRKKKQKLNLDSQEKDKLKNKIKILIINNLSYNQLEKTIILTILQYKLIIITINQ